MSCTPTKLSYYRIRLKSILTKLGHYSKSYPSRTGTISLYTSSPSIIYLQLRALDFNSPPPVFKWILNAAFHYVLHTRSALGRQGSPHIKRGGYVSPLNLSLRPIYPFFVCKTLSSSFVLAHDRTRPLYNGKEAYRFMQGKLWGLH
ncbi:hypothetical protein TNIN_265671 [Trichonephila inaurata madagascariensis]|uniref:Uncharacterized protein n=1 Tax=Trichonephila inaurata madagascariensis TaxID=2747483 RepID=A0A8X7BP20_9ARAC|nr:hypothetical protein TNIN_265671 [Trichonephila inaurata madagascariensis]